LMFLLLLLLLSPPLRLVESVLLVVMYALISALDYGKHCYTYIGIIFFL